MRLCGAHKTGVRTGRRSISRRSLVISLPSSWEGSCLGWSYSASTCSLTLKYSLATVRSAMRAYTRVIRSLEAHAAVDGLGR
jgi:hypothetical protein